MFALWVCLCEFLMMFLESANPGARIENADAR